MSIQEAWFYSCCAIVAGVVICTLIISYFGRIR